MFVYLLHIRQIWPPSNKKEPVWRAWMRAKHGVPDVFRWMEKGAGKSV